MEKRIEPILTVRAYNQDALLPLVAWALSKQDVNILGHSEHSENGEVVLSLLVDRPETARNTLEESGLSIQQEECVTAEYSNTTRSAAELTRPLREQNVKLEGSFPFVAQKGQGLAIRTPNAQHTLNQINNV